METVRIWRLIWYKSETIAYRFMHLLQMLGHVFFASESAIARWALRRLINIPCHCQSLWRFCSARLDIICTVGPIHIHWSLKNSHCHIRIFIWMSHLERISFKNNEKSTLPTKGQRLARCSQHPQPAVLVIHDGVMDLGPGLVRCHQQPHLIVLVIYAVMVLELFLIGGCVHFATRIRFQREYEKKKLLFCSDTSFHDFSRRSQILWKMLTHNSNQSLGNSMSGCFFS